MPTGQYNPRSIRTSGWIIGFLVILGSVSLLAALSLWGWNREQAPDLRLAIIAGNSMVPHYWGEHLAFTCPDCAFPFETSVDAPQSRLIVCPNCGFREIPVSSGERRDAERFYIKPLGERPLSRWDVVAIAEPDTSPQRFFIKRIVGLPREKLEMNDGELLVNDQSLTLDWAEIDEQRILVFDSAFDPKSKPRERIVVSPAECWRANAAGWLCLPMPDSAETPRDDQLPTWAYQSWRCYRHAGSRDELGPVDDVYSFDQTISRTVHPTDSLMTSIEVVASPNSEIAIRREYLGRVLEVVLSWRDGTVHVRQEDGNGEWEIIKTFPFPRIEAPRPMTIEIATLTGRLGIRVNGIFNEWVRWEKRASKPTERVLQVQVLRGGVEVRRLKIWRAIYWFDQLPGMRAPAEVSRVFQVPDGHYFVMGDNVPVSKDSRDWDPPYVPLERVVGLVTRDAKPE